MKFRHYSNILKKEATVTWIVTHSSVPDTWSSLNNVNTTGAVNPNGLYYTTWL